MSAPPSIDAYDAQMLDFSSDPDVPMNIAASAEFFTEALMDHDDHLAASAYAEHASVEIDMEEYVGDNAEYEMADETAEYHRDELLDVEVYDASHVPSPLVPPQSLQPSADVTIDSEHPESTPPVFSEHAASSKVPPEPEAPLDHSAADASHVEPAALVEVVSSESAGELVHPVEAPDENILASESREHLGETAPTDGHTYETPAPVDVDEGQPHIPSVSEEHPASPEAAQHETAEPPTAESAPLAEDARDGVSLAQVEKVAEQVSEGEVVDPLLISDGVYIDPPPAVLLSIADLSEPSFTLFNQPEAEGELAEEPRGGQKVFSLLLESRPTLYYEPLTNVFAALRQDEGLLSRVPHSFEGELILDAYDLQLAVSEDNVHSREISLHDLNILHDGSDFAGPLRLLLRAAVPRFIVRYYALQDQIQRLNLVVETGEEEHTEEHHGHFDAREEQPQPQHEDAAGQLAINAQAVSEGLEAASSTAETEEQPAKEIEVYPEPSKEYLHEDNEPADVFGVREPAAEYHEVAGEATHALEDEDDYEGTSADDEDQSATSESLDADQIHNTVAEDTDAPTTVTGHESEFGGEQTEYLDYVQPEEYDERYGEDLPERAGGSSPAQYGEQRHYEEEGEQDTSTAVDETHVLPGADEDEGDESGETPVPTHTLLESESSELATVESALVQQENPVPTNEELVSKSKSTNEVDGVQATGNQVPSAAQAKIFSEVEESDSNFVALLEREADAEFDRTFNADQSGQEASIEATLQHEEAWDEWDDEDAEGEDEEDWMDPDAASNESSVTLSSKTSSKRGYDEVDPSEELYVENPPSSPGSKRPRIQ